MMDFLKIAVRSTKRGVEIYPNFIINNKSSDLMIRGSDFYAIWIDDRNLWSTDEQDVISMVDRELDKFAEENKDKYDGAIKVLHMWDSETGIIDRWHKYCQKQMRDNYHTLDEKLIFSNEETTKKDYASRKLDYPLEEGSFEAYDRMMSVLYSPEERHKIEWAIGSVVVGDSKKLQKFMVLYGAAGTGKSTVLNIIEKLFKGYWSVFDAKALGSSSNVFALEAFKSSPLVAIQHDGDLSHIEDNTRLNSLVSHETMTVNEKYRSTYSNQFKAFLFMGTNKPVKITDAKSGLIRRLIDVSPTGDKLTYKEYRALIKQIDFELGAIAYHCKEVYLSDPNKYDNYIPIAMMGASNDFYNFMLDSYYVFAEEDGTSLKAAWEMYNTYCAEAKVPYQMSQRVFKEELKNYFKEYKDRCTLQDGSRSRSYYKGFKTDKFEEAEVVNESPIESYRINFNSTKSIFDEQCADCPAQEASEKEIPLMKWDNVTTKLSDIDTTKLHFVKVPLEHIVIDFDIPDENGQKSLERNLEEASKWPKTYAELSKSGKGIHLHYIYTGGDPNKLSRIFDDHIEVKVFTGKSSLRRKLTKCNDIPIKTISSGLPLKGEDKMVNFKELKSERSLRILIKRALNKEIHPNTKPNIDFIYKILEEASQSNLSYDVSDMKRAILAFAGSSTNQSSYCLTLCTKMKFRSDKEDSVENHSSSKLIFYDVEVFPNLFLVNWKIQGEGNPVIRMINPTPDEIEKLVQSRLVGFNCRRYDNHILYGRLIGYTNEQLYDLSQRIINGETSCFFGKAYDLSYTDVYDFSSKKQSLKKFEIELGIHHKELGLPWDKPVPEEKWKEVAEYCDNDVLATEAVFNARQADFTAREILAAVAGMTVNDTTNSLTTRIIFGNDRSPQGQFNYRNMGDTSQIDENYSLPEYSEFTRFDSKGRPIFPGYTFIRGKSIYRDEEVGEGGYVYSEPGMYTNVALLDIASMHPSSIVAEELFGPKYTARFKDILDARIAIKHKEFDRARKMLNGALAPYLTDENSAAGLAQALKIAINSVYGLTSARFENPMRDVRNIDNIVAKRGALFMINLKHEVQSRGFTVAHIKTDSIKIPNATPEIIQFVMDYGKLYGYNFEHEDTYDRMCLVNDAVYIAKYIKPHIDKETKKEIWWTATGTQFQIPYVFKTLFSKEEIEFKDMCETKSVTSALYLDTNENLEEGQHDYHFIGKVGSFCPIKPGCGGGILLRENTSKTGETTYASAVGAKGYRWLESEMVKELHKEDCIDRSYYNALVDAAVKDISQYGDFEWFAE